jgi:hypothetical protein
MLILKQKKFFIAALVLVCLMSLWMPFSSRAAAYLVPCGGPTQNPCTVVDIFTLVARVTNWLIAVSGLYAVYLLINAGFYLAISVGNEESITKYKSSIINALVGLVLALAAFMIVNTVVNVLLTRTLITSTNTSCVLDLKNPLNYLTINQSPCSNVNDTTLHSQ